MAAIQVNMRVPEVLLARINAAAGDERTKWILEACRMRLYGCDKCAQRSAQASAMAGYDGQPSLAYEAAVSKPEKGALREICAGRNQPIDEVIDATGHVLPVGTKMVIAKLCIVCESPMREVKGKWACVDVSCGMYGKEQKVKG